MKKKYIFLFISIIIIIFFSIYINSKKEYRTELKVVKNILSELSLDENNYYEKLNYLKNNDKSVNNATSLYYMPKYTKENRILWFSSLENKLKTNDLKKIFIFQYDDLYIGYGPKGKKIFNLDKYLSLNDDFSNYDLFTRITKTVYKSKKSYNNYNIFYKVEKPIKDHKNIQLFIEDKNKNFMFTFEKSGLDKNSSLMEDTLKKFVYNVNKIN